MEAIHNAVINPVAARKLSAVPLDKEVLQRSRQGPRLGKRSGAAWGKDLAAAPLGEELGGDVGLSLFRVWPAGNIVPDHLLALPSKAMVTKLHYTDFNVSGQGTLARRRKKKRRCSEGNSAAMYATISVVLISYACTQHYTNGGI